MAEQSLFSEAYARRHGLLQSLDVRIKLFTFLCLLVLISFLHTPRALWMMYGLSLVLAVGSRVPLWFFLKRVWLFVPLFSAAVVLPALLNIVTPGEPLWILVESRKVLFLGALYDPAEIAVTRQGLWGAITLRLARGCVGFLRRAVHADDSLDRYLRRLFVRCSYRGYSS